MRVNRPVHQTLLYPRFNAGARDEGIDCALKPLTLLPILIETFADAAPIVNSHADYNSSGRRPEVKWSLRAVARKSPNAAGLREKKLNPE